MLTQGFVTAQLSSRGGRTCNEDCTGTASSGNTSCWVVADGLGGHGGGAEAARIACEGFVASFADDPGVTAERMRRYICDAHTAVQRLQRESPTLRQMRATIVALVADATIAVWGHMGDSRLYHLRGGTIVEQTKDHSVPQSLVDAGLIRADEVRYHVDRGRLLRALGEDERLEPEIRMEPVSLRPDDAFLLCTDGFWERVEDAEMEADLAISGDPAQWLRWMERRLFHRVRGSYDNYTALVMMGNVAPGCDSRGELG